MGPRRMCTLHALPLLGGMGAYGCGHNGDSSLPLGPESTTSNTAVTAGYSSTSVPPVNGMPVASSSPNAELSPPPWPSTSASAPPVGSNGPDTSPTPHVPNVSGEDAGTYPAEVSSGGLFDDDGETYPIGNTSTDGPTSTATTPEEPLDSSSTATATAEYPQAGEGSITEGRGGVVNSTITVRAGEIFDGGGKTFTAGSALGDGSQDEDQLPVFLLEDGAQLRNVTLGSPAADGIHCYGDVMLNDIHWQDIGEDALTVKESGTVIIDGGSAQNGDDKVFQINAASTFIVRNFTARNAGKFIRQNGDTTFRVDVVIENCDISQMDECIFRSDSSTSTVTMRDTRYSDLGDGLFVGVNANNITLGNNTEY